MIAGQVFVFGLLDRALILLGLALSSSAYLRSSCYNRPRPIFKCLLIAFLTFQ